jgi:hypothetical protein
MVVFVSLLYWVLGIKSSALCTLSICPTTELLSWTLWSYSSKSSVDLKIPKIESGGRALVAHTCDPSYSGGSWFKASLGK